MPDYDATHFAPPAPVAPVAVRGLSDGTKVVHAVLLLDTGADATLLPRTCITGLGVEPITGLRYELAAFDGSRSFAEVADLALTFLNRTFKGRYLLIEADEGVLGRDVLNHVSLILDGPRKLWSECASRV